MGFNEEEHANLLRKAAHYKEMLQNTVSYREAWRNGLKEEIKTTLQKLLALTGIPATLEERADVVNLEAILLDFGSEESGLSEPVSGIQRSLIKQNGSLVYQQLYNGKILVVINYPFIEKYGQPKEPRTIAIYRPHELKEPYLLRHLETVLTEISDWEDYDDEIPEPNQRIGYKMNFTKAAQDQAAEAGG